MVNVISYNQSVNLDLLQQFLDYKEEITGESRCVLLFSK